MPYPYDDMRSLLDDCEGVGEAIRIKKEVDWNLEVGAIFRRLAETSLGKNVKDGGSPAPIFENIKGYPGWRMAANTLGNQKRLAMALGAKDSDKATYKELQEMYIQGLANRIKPKVVSTGPCKENKVFGDDTNLYDIPAPYLHDGDGGRYFATCCFFVTKDPETGWINYGTYRAMIHDKRSFGMLLLPFQHIGMHYRKYEERDEPMPFALAIGPDPLSFMCASVPVPYGVPDMEVAGGLREKPLEVVKCETNDLLVPAGTEIVVEGIIPPRIRAMEGPFGEYTGYRASPRDMRHIGVVKAVTWRNDPIFYFTNPGLPVCETDTMWGVATAALVKEHLKNLGLPVVDVSVPCETSCQLIVVTTKTPMMRMAPRIASAVFGMGAIAGYCPKLMVCNDDIDPFNFAQVVHALITKCHPDRGQFSYYHPVSPLCPYGDLEERHKGTSPQGVYDCTWPVDWPIYEAVPPKSSFTTLYPQEIQKKVLDNWSAYGFK